ncbi:hypothetical protein I5L01_09175 [Erythrobacter sp. YJ-T3-07]|nr:hypothetical protein [Erythrobacter sp. YJ-T3-07]
MIEEKGAKLIVQTRPSGKVDYRAVDKDKSLMSGGRVTLVKTEVSDRLYLDIFEIDKGLIEWFKNYRTFVDDLIHLQNGLFDYTEEGTDDNIIFFDGFVDWALNQMPELKSRMLPLFEQISDREELGYELIDVPQNLLWDDKET